MADPFIAEIRIFPFNFAPRGWAWCDGQILPLAQNTALFSLLGTTYGGNGQSTFALPNLQGRSPMHPGQGPGLSLHDLGEEGGSELVSLLESEIPNHSHFMMAQNQPAQLAAPGSDRTFSRSSGGFAYKAAPFAQIVNLNDNMIAPAGGGIAHNNLMPYLTFYFCIALQGVFPPRT
ncbi:phage tail protein [Mesorhizobium sp. LjRoot246]|uniref:phage tail protein n=1 Tax=Mesorhizobium sp. LjRoot246 TaxID=3342294 RepID=UPI003ECFAE8A